jgi:hypothetical protein
MTLKAELLKLIEKLGLLEELVDTVPVPPEVQVIDTKIEAITGQLKVKLGQE